MADTTFIDQVIDYAVEAVEADRPLTDIKREVWPLTPPEPESFIGDDDQTIEYQPAANLARRAFQLIQEYPELAHVQGLEVRFLWRGSGGTSAGKRVLGKCSKISGAARYFSAEETGVPADVLIWLAADHLQHATDRGIEAVLYHELLHIGWDDEKDKLVINAHDVEGFVREIERYGLHTGDLRRTEQAMRQLRLGENGGA